MVLRAVWIQQRLQGAYGAGDPVVGRDHADWPTFPDVPAALGESF
jgi:hypothetical protein